MQQDIPGFGTQRGQGRQARLENTGRSTTPTRVENRDRAASRRDHEDGHTVRHGDGEHEVGLNGRVAVARLGQQRNRVGGGRRRRVQANDALVNLPGVHGARDPHPRCQSSPTSARAGFVCNAPEQREVAGFRRGTSRRGPLCQPREPRDPLGMHERIRLGIQNLVQGRDASRRLGNRSHAAMLPMR